MRILPPETRSPSRAWSTGSEWPVVSEQTLIVTHSGVSRRTTPLTSDAAQMCRKEVRRCPNRSW